MKRLAGWLGVLVLGMGALWTWLPRGSRPALGVTNHRLQDCPSSPNCVCTDSSSPTHQIDALSFKGSPPEIQDRLRQLLDSQPGWRRVDSQPGYLRYEAISRWWRFVDDVEFLLEPASGRIRMRSASRIGHHDLGANRRRLEEVRGLWLRMSEPPAQ
jgi:uncharacterized protein (DUF1499 family)